MKEEGREGRNDGDRLSIHRVVEELFSQLPGIKM